MDALAGKAMAAKLLALVQASSEINKGPPSTLDEVDPEKLRVHRSAKVDAMATIHHMSHDRVAYEKGPGLALLFADEREARFPPARSRLAKALSAAGFTVKELNARDVVAQIKRELDAAAADSKLCRFVFAFDGHGGYADGQLSGFICCSDGMNLPVDRIVHEVCTHGPFRHAWTPKLFILDCCYSHLPGGPAGGSGGIPNDPAGPAFHDVALLRCTSPGKYGYTGDGKGGRADEGEGYTTLLADNILAHTVGKDGGDSSLSRLHDQTVRDMELRWGSLGCPSGMQVPVLSSRLRAEFYF